jgi:hypothetical protein
MLPVKLHTSESQNFNLQTYAGAITHIASHTVIGYRGEELRPLGNDNPSFDISQVCCWMCEKPLGNSMHLCTTDDGSGKVKIISEPQDNDAEDEEHGMQIESGSFINVHQNTKCENMLLICGDCCEGLKKSLAYLDDKQNEQTLIKDPFNPSINVTGPQDPKYYIWPNEKVSLSEQSIARENLNSSSTKHPDRIYTAQDCFIYTKKSALIKHMAEDEGNEALIEVSSELQQYIFVEPNPALPEPLFVAAQNTIRLFRLNSKYYEHSGRDYHVIQYSDSNNEIFYDDLRLAGRGKAYKRARTALKQLKNVRDAYLEPEIINALIQQQKILMELNGYRSVWATVFNDGDDPGGFIDIVGCPAPVGPITSTEDSESLLRKRSFASLDTAESFSTEMSKILDKDNYKTQINEPEFNKIIKKLFIDKEKWVRIENNSKYEKIKKEKQSETIELLSPAFSSYNLTRKQKKFLKDNMVLVRKVQSMRTQGGEFIS